MQIVQATLDIAFGVEQMSLDQYIDWVVENAYRLTVLRASPGSTAIRFHP